MKVTPPAPESAATLPGPRASTGPRPALPSASAPEPTAPAVRGLWTSTISRGRMRKSSNPRVTRSPCCRSLLPMRTILGTAPPLRAKTRANPLGWICRCQTRTRRRRLRTLRFVLRSSMGWSPAARSATWPTSSTCLDWRGTSSDTPRASSAGGEVSARARASATLATDVLRTSWPTKWSRGAGPAASWIMRATSVTSSVASSAPSRATSSANAPTDRRSARGATGPATRTRSVPRLCTTRACRMTPTCSTVAA
mmetsp:Transcript_19905/g.60062  ORF Transcript_19905/g.60062 Transcript_19905/m.60062 type:complete len:254 (+) Transcript_19905:482-1243(+)